MRPQEPQLYWLSVELSRQILTNSLFYSSYPEGHVFVPETSGCSAEHRWGRSSSGPKVIVQKESRKIGSLLSRNAADLSIGEAISLMAKWDFYTSLWISVTKWLLPKPVVWASTWFQWLWRSYSCFRDYVFWKWWVHLNLCLVSSKGCTHTLGHWGKNFDYWESLQSTLKSTLYGVTRWLIPKFCNHHLDPSSKVLMTTLNS